MAKGHPIVAALYDRVMHVTEQRGLAALLGGDPAPHRILCTVCERAP
jgi:hypothetical protein